MGVSTASVAWPFRFLPVTVGKKKPAIEFVNAWLKPTRLTVVSPRTQEPITARSSQPLTRQRLNPTCARWVSTKGRSFSWHGAATSPRATRRLLRRSVAVRQCATAHAVLQGEIFGPCLTVVRADRTRKERPPVSRHPDQPVLPMAGAIFTSNAAPRAKVPAQVIKVGMVGVQRAAFPVPVFLSHIRRREALRHLVTTKTSMAPKACDFLDKDSKRSPSARPKARNSGDPGLHHSNMGVSDMAETITRFTFRARLNRVALRTTWNGRKPQWRSIGRRPMAEIAALVRKKSIRNRRSPSPSSPDGRTAAFAAGRRHSSGLQPPGLSPKCTWEDYFAGWDRFGPPFPQKPVIAAVERASGPSAGELASSP